ncbi:glycosyl transferase family 2 [Kitasatospora sp. SolWspMP-SS2h]|uniref:glycosyltransferase n=1 Tax=Kitasatospora sp. SolWspMP-SS2h TaxID=1305729 RepID=UPI000DBAAA34|nr:glycosyltransferase family 2 protein [Kitasatospora sp. SolWspMP-SS2h]RAJ39991.1 glycosyl transferase family 2 [Kitasatospora sp. SolWspMP-SS2h]
MIRAVAVVVPARDEEELLGSCLTALHRALRHPRVRALPHRVVVVADACTDGTAEVARRYGAQVLELTAGNVGAARAAGSERAVDLALATGSALAPAGVWLAHTDADSRVPSAWLARQLDHAALGWHAVVGTVRVTDWTGHRQATAGAFRRHYRHPAGAGGHRHVHGANLAVRADAYRAVGGFAPLAVGEDRALVAALEAAGHRVRRIPDTPVTTSARRDPRAPGGFGDFLRGLDSLTR